MTFHVSLYIFLEHLLGLFCPFAYLQLVFNRIWISLFFSKSSSDPFFLLSFSFCFFSNLNGASPLSFISITCIIFLYSIELFYDLKLAENLNLIYVNLRVLIQWVFDLQCKVVVKLADIRSDMVSRLDLPEMCMGKFLLWFHEDIPARLKEMGTEQVQKMLQVSSTIALSCEKDEQVHPTILWVFIDN